MSRRARAAVTRAAGDPPVIEEWAFADPAAGEVLIRVAATGVCHTDMAMARGDLWPVYPVVLGHEMAGTIEACGPEVAGLTAGQRVVVLDGHCGRCADCERGHPVLCQTFDRAERWRHLTDGCGEKIFQSTGGFAELLLMPAHSVFPVPDDVSLEIAAVASCAGVTGIGAVLNVGEVRAGDSVAVVGCGGVGLSAVMAAVAAGASSVVAVDREPGRRALARQVGAEAAVDADLDAIRGIRPGGFDVVVEAAGNPAAMTLATRIARRGGRAVITGALAAGVMMQIEVLDLVLGQVEIRGALRGDVRPDVDMPRIFDLYRAGRLPLDRLITERIGFDELAGALAGRSAGVRSVLTLAAP